MKQFIATIHGEQIATLADHPDLAYTIASLVCEWIRAGWQISYQADPVTVQEQPSEPAPQKKRLGRPRHSLPESHRVYLKWSCLNQEQRLTLSQYRTTAAVVVEKRHAVGTAVRFDDNAELVWLPGRCLSRVPEID